MLMKLVVDATTDRVVGCHIVGDGAAEMVQAARHRGQDEGDQGRLRRDDGAASDRGRRARDHANAERAPCAAGRGVGLKTERRINQALNARARRVRAHAFHAAQQSSPRHGTSNPDNRCPAANISCQREIIGKLRDQGRTGHARLDFALSVLGIFVGADAARAGPSTTARDPSVDPATFTEEANQETEDLIGLNKAKRRDVQRRLTRLGFKTRINGKFDDSTRAAITRWQGARDYPKTGFLNTLQHQALKAQSVSAAHASLRSSDASDNDHAARHRGRNHAHHSRRGGIGGPVGLIGGMMGGLFR